METEKICGLVGKTLRQSISPFVHSLFASYEYRLFPMDEKELEKFFLEKNFGFVNVTVPYKKKVIKFCDSLTERASKIGAVNTIVNRNGVLVGENTDYIGFQFMLREKNIDVRNRQVLVLGSGGTSLTARHALSDMGAEDITVVSRTGETNYQNVYDKFPDAEIIVNTTPVGMFPDNGNCPVDIKKFRNLYAAADVVYNPLKTEFMRLAEEAGAIFTGGLNMLVSQAVYSSAFYTGRNFSDGEVRSFVKKTLKYFTNLVFIGMPGCGKSRIGRACARMQGRKFIDTDREILKETGKTAEEIIKTQGEKYFREIEREAIKKASLEKGCVISVGGGAVLDPENIKELRRNGMIVFLSRDRENLSLKGRPLSESMGTKALEKERMPLYEKYSDFTIENAENRAKETSEAVWRKFNENFDN